MNLARLIIEEIRHRKLGTLLSVAAVTAAVACLTGSLLLLDAFDRRTEETVAQAQQLTQERVEKLKTEARESARTLEDDYRKITKGLGFNLLILPADQNWEDWLRDDFGRHTLPEDSADRLGKNAVVTVNHLLPVLAGRVQWPEQKRAVILLGVRGQVPILKRPPDGKPIMEPVPKGTVVLGHELGSNLGLKKGDALTFHGQSYKVHDVYAPRGNKDDITLWIGLARAQELLNQPGKINAIFALQCHCETADRVTRIEQEVKSILGDGVQIREIAGQAMVRTLARVRAAEEAQRQVNQAEEEGNAQVLSLRTTRQDLRRERLWLAGLLIPTAVLGASGWLASAAVVNVRQRRGEIGLLRALGVSGGRILALFLGKALLIGLVGAVLGAALGLLAGGGADRGQVLALVGSIVVLAPVVAVVASWVPALTAIRMDPAIALREE
jgi:hypothetical protein